MIPVRCTDLSKYICTEILTQRSQVGLCLQISLPKANNISKASPAEYITGREWSGGEHFVQENR